MATPRPRGGTSLTVRPSIWTSPEDGFSSPATIRRKVVLPQPEGPSRTMNSPSRTDRLMPSTATTSPNSFLISLVAMCAIAAPLSRPRGRPRPAGRARSRPRRHRPGRVLPTAQATDRARPRTGLDEPRVRRTRRAGPEPLTPSTSCRCRGSASRPTPRPLRGSSCRSRHSPSCRG